MKILKIIFAIAILTISISCSKDDPAIKDEPTVIDTKLKLPAIFQNNTLTNIPDCTVSGNVKTPGLVESTIEIKSDGIIADPSKVVLELDLSHQWSGDIVVELIAPSGENCGIIKRIGTTSDTSISSSIDFVLGNKLKFNSLHSTFLLPQIGSGILAGNYAPSRGASSIPFSVPMTALNTFLMDKNIKGNWTIKIYDYENNDFGNLNSWKLYFEAGALQ